MGEVKLPTVTDLCRLFGIGIAIRTWTLDVGRLTLSVGRSVFSVLPNSHTHALFPPPALNHR